MDRPRRRLHGDRLHRGLDNPYEELQLRGVAEIEPDPEMVVLDALSHKYTSQPFRVRFEGCVTLRITITSFRHTVHAEEHTPADR